MYYKLILLLFCALYPATVVHGAVRQLLGRPDLVAIKAATTDPDSKYYYPRLLKQFLANDTVMVDVDFQYFYYGTFFQEDYDPYRSPVNQDELNALAPIYAKTDRTRADRARMLAYAEEAINDNPVNLRQLTNRIFVYEQNGKFDLARIWQYKLNHLLLVIASSGTGLDAENAWMVVYPQDEYDFLNLSGHTATQQRFEPPHYDYIAVMPKNESTPAGYFFNISEMLNQYYLKHPSELNNEQ